MHFLAILSTPSSDVSKQTLANTTLNLSRIAKCYILTLLYLSNKLAKIAQNILATFQIPWYSKDSDAVAIKPPAIFTNNSQNLSICYCSKAFGNKYFGKNDTNKHKFTLLTQLKKGRCSNIIIVIIATVIIIVIIIIIIIIIHNYFIYSNLWSNNGCLYKIRETCMENADFSWENIIDLIMSAVGVFQGLFSKYCRFKEPWLCK